MANFLGVHLSRLVRERAYRAGELSKIERREAALRQKLAPLIREHQELRRARRENQARIAELDGELKEQGAELDLDAIRPIVATPRRYVAKHGTFRAALVEYLIARQDTPIPTAPIVEHMAAKFSMPTTTAQEHRTAMRVVSRELRELVYIGAVERLIDLKNPSLRRWRWIGL